MARFPRPLRLRVLGPPDIHVEGEGAPSLRHRKGVATLLYLAAAARPVARSELISLLWADMPEDPARNNLRVVISDLKKRLGTYLTIRRSDVALDLGRHVKVDLHSFRAWARDDAPYGRTLLDAPYATFLDGFGVPGADAYDAWVLRTRDSIRAEAHAAFVTAADAAADDGRTADAVVLLRRAIEAAPWDEATHRTLIRLLATHGQQAAARVQFEACRRALQEHLGVEPAAATYADLERNLRPRRTAVAPETSVGELVPLYGRETLLATLQGLLGDATVRLLSVLGLPGVGRSRLLREALRGLPDDPMDRTVSVSLRDARGASAVWARVADALGAPAELEPMDPERPLDDVSRGRVERAIGTQAMRLVLEDVEPDVDLAGDVALLLAACNELAIVLVAFSELGFLGERVVIVPPLETPLAAFSAEVSSTQAAELRKAAPIEMMVDVAKRRDAAFTLHDEDLPAFAALASELGGHPVALILAGWRISYEGAAAVRASWRDVDRGIARGGDAPHDLEPRHRHLDTAFAPILRALPEAQRRIVDALAMFHAAAPYAAVAEVARTSESVVEQVVAHLVRKRIATVHTTHGIAVVRIAPVLSAVLLAAMEGADHADAYRDAHAAWCLRHSTRLEAALLGQDQAHAITAFGEAYADVDAAAAYLEAQKPLRAIQLRTALWRFAVRAGDAEPAYARLVRLLEGHGNDLDPLPQGDAYNAAGALAFSSNRRSDAARWYERALAVRRESNDPQRIAGSLLNVATVHALRNERDDAMAFLDQALAVVDRSDLPWLVAGIQVNRGHVLFDLGAYDEASEAYERGLGRFLELGDADAVIGTAVGLVRCAAANGDRNAVMVGVDNLAEFMMTMTPTDLPGLLPIFESLERQLERAEHAKAACIVAELRSAHLIPVSRSPARTGSATPPALVFEPLAI